MSKLSVLLLLFSLDAFANTLFIPSYYRNRRTLTQYSALAFTERREVGAAYRANEGETKSGGTKVFEDSATTISGHGFYRLTKTLNLEGQVGSTASKWQSYPSSVEATSDSISYNAGVGAELDRLGVGISYSGSNTDNGQASGISDSNSHTLGLGLGYRFGENFYLGSGYSAGRYLYAGATDESVTYTVGVGRVFGERQAPDAAAEVAYSWMNEEHTRFSIASANWLHNVSAETQGYLRASYQWSAGDYSSSGVTARLGADLKYGNLYFGPEISFSKSESKGIPASEDKSLGGSLELGFRSLIIETYIRYSYQASEAEYASFSPATESSDQSLSGGLAYFIP